MLTAMFGNNREPSAVCNAYSEAGTDRNHSGSGPLHGALPFNSDHICPAKRRFGMFADLSRAET
jgi:hypothetical protein